MKILLNIAVMIYIFLVFNREFVPLIDLRFIAMPIFLILVLIKLIQFIQKKYLRFYASKRIFLLCLLFIFIISISNIKWYFNPYEPNKEVLIHIIALYIYNFFAILVFSLYWQKINIKLVTNILIISGFILFISLIAQYLGVQHLPFAGQLKEPIENNFSFLGKRYGGYAEDQNYASFGMVIWALTSSIFLKNRYVILLIYILSTIGLLLSFSKTIILGIFFILSIYVTKKLKILIPYILFIMLITIYIGYYIFEFLSELSTMSIRFFMWRTAFNSILDNPILGSGITSVRSNFLYHGGWYIQPHNSYLAIFADSGFFAFILFIIFLKLTFKIPNFYYNYLVGILIFFLFTYELFVCQYPYFVLGILPILILMKQKKIYITKIRM